MRVAPVLALVLGVVPACAESPEIGVAYRCDPTLCGSNSPVLADLPFADFNLDHDKNDEGFAYYGMSKDGTVLDLEVVDSQMKAHDRFGQPYVGTDLVGAVLYFATSRGQYGIVIDHLGSAEETVPGGDTLESYYFVWATVIRNPLRAPLSIETDVPGGVLPELGSEITELCPDYFDEDWWFGRGEWDETSRSMEAFEAIVFEGDRINKYSRTVKPTYDDRWVNIGCAAHTLSKMRLSRSTIHTASSWEQEQATLKMLSADYCGSGMAFTYSGEPLVWRNLVGFDYYKPAGTLEARWNQDGALCIGEPRLVTTTNEKAKDEFPDVAHQIKEECDRVGRPVQWCDNNLGPYDLEYTPGEIITSANRDP